MAFFELNVLSVGENGDTERIEIGSNYINMMDSSSNSLFLLNSSNNITSINSSLQFNVLPSVNFNNTSSYIATTNYVDSNISYMNASISSLINDANTSINIINASLLNMNDSIINLSNNASVYESLNEYIATVSGNAIDSVEFLDSFFVLPLASIKLNEYISSISINAVEAIEMLNTFFVVPVSDIVNDINVLNSSMNNLTNYVNNLSSNTNGQLDPLNNSSIIELNSSVTSIKKIITDTGLNSSSLDYPGALIIGGNTALLSIGRAGTNTSILGDMTISGTLTTYGLDTDQGGLRTSTIDASATSLAIGGGSTTIINLGRTGQTTTVLGNETINGILNVSGVITASTGIKTTALDTITATVLNIGSTTATSVNVGKSGVATGILGNATITGITTATGGLKTASIDTATATTLAIGPTLATAVNIGANTAITGTLSASDTITATGGLRTPIPIRPTYSTLPTFTSSQIGYTITNVISTTVVPTLNDSAYNLYTESLPIGVWAVSYQIHLTTTNSQTATLTEFQSNINLATDMETIGEYAMIVEKPLSIGISTTNNYTRNGSVIIHNTLASNSCNLKVTIGWNAGTGEVKLKATNTYLKIVRIA